MSLLHQIATQLEGSHFALKLIEKEVEQRKVHNLIIGSTEPTIGRHPKEMKSSLVKINIENIDDGKRIAVVSKTGSGKTTLMASMLFFGKISGFQLFIPFDFKAEYPQLLSKFSIAYYGRNIFEDDLVSLYPYYLKEVAGFRREDSFQFDVADLSESELEILLNVHGAKDFRKRDLLFNIISKLPESRKTIQEVVDILNDRVRLENLAGKRMDMTISSVIASVGSAIRYNILGSAYRKNIEGLISSGKTVDICFPRWDDFHASITQSYVAVLEKMLKKSLEKKRRHVLTAIDEGRIIIPKSKSEGDTSRQEIIKNIKTTRYLGETMIFGVQDLKDVEESVVGQASYYFISHKIQVRDVKRLLDSTSLPDNVKYSVMEDKLPKLHLLAATNPQCRPWLMISEDERSAIVYPFLGK